MGISTYSFAHDEVKTPRGKESSDYIHNYQKITGKIGKSSTVFLVNFAIDELKKKIALDMENTEIKAVIIKDLFLKENIVIAYREKEKVKFLDSPPKELEDLRYFKENIIQEKGYSQTAIGEISVYFSTYNEYISLTQEEKSYLDLKKEIKYCIDPNWMPLEGLEDNRHIGISSNYIEIFSKRAGVKMTLVPTTSWEESLHFVKERKCDALSLASKTKSRSEFLDFTSSYLETPIVVATKVGIPFIDDISLIVEKKLGVVKGYSLLETIREEYPYISLVEVDSIQDGLKRVEDGEIFGYLDNTIVINHEIQQNFVGTLAISGKLNYKILLSFATRNDEKILKKIFEKVILSLEKETKIKLLNKWVRVNYNTQTNYKILVNSIVIFIVIIIAVIYWNRRLSKLNRQLAQQRDRAEEMTRIKSEFLANMSHEIRTPMNGIIGMSHIVLQSELNYKQRNFIEKIDNSAKQLLGIINDILDLSKMEAGKMELESVQFDLYEIINDSISLIETKTNEKGLSVVVHYNESIGRYFHGDPLRVLQILNNLLSNATKFTHKGEILVYVLKGHEGKIRIEVKDTGIGLDSEDKKKLFDSFSQGDGTTTRNYGGTGLGLTITKQLISMMNGEIWVESQKGVGSNFIFEIDLGEAEVKKECSSTISSGDSSNIKLPSLVEKKILVVEDNVINQDVLVGLLEESGVGIDIAEDGEVAVKLFQKNHYDLIFMDIQMPIMDGFAATQIIRESNKKVPIIALTANVLKDDIQKSKDAGMNGHLNKPLNVKELFQVVKKFLDVEVKSVKNQQTSEISIPDFKHIDTKIGLEQLNGNRKLYLKLLRDFENNYRDLQLETLDKDDFERAIHTIKGVSGTIGAKALNTIATEIDKSQNRELLELLYGELLLVLTDLKSIEKAHEEHSKKSASKVSIEKLFLDLREAIKRTRPREFKALLVQLDSIELEKDDKEVFLKLKEYLKAYKFKEAIEEIDKREA